MNPSPPRFVIPDLIRDPSSLPLCLEVCQQAGGCPAASNFLLRRQKKVTKEKATRLSGSLRFATGNLRCSIPAGGVRTRFAQTTAALDTASICAARPGQTGFGREAGFGEAGTRKARPRRSPIAYPCPRSIPALTPVGLGRGAQAKADQGSRLSEPKASSSETPLLPSTAGCLERSGRSQTIGSPFFWVLFFGDAKKSASPAGARPGLLANHKPRIKENFPTAAAKARR